MVNYVDSTETTYLSLFAGAGGLDLGFQRAVRGARAVGYVENDAEACALLVDHMEAELLHPAPLWTDALTFDGALYRGRVDWVIGGPPCQPFSVAGKRRAADDPRNLWPQTLRLVGEIQPTGCFFENVPSADSLWYIYSEVLPGLRHLGYQVAVGIFSAAEVGAPHQRERVFILAANTELDRLPEPWLDWARPSNIPADDFAEASGLVDAFRRSALPYLCPGHDGIPRKLVGLPRVARLRMLGNAVVAATAEKAFRTLAGEMKWNSSTSTRYPKAHATRTRVATLHRPA